MTESKPIVPGNENTTDREFRQPGYYAILPARVRYDKRLAPMERILYAEITALAQVDGACTAKTAYFCELYGVAESTVFRWLSNLQKYGYICSEKVENNGMISGRRITLMSEHFPPSQKSEDVLSFHSSPSSQKQEVFNRKNNINNTPLPPKGASVDSGASVASGESVAPSQTDKLFDIFWAAYPRKADKKKARRAFGRIKGLDKPQGSHPLFPVLMRALERQKRSEQWNRDGGKYIPLPSTWLNGERWDDDPSGAAFPRQRQVEDQIGGYREVHKAL